MERTLSVFRYVLIFVIIAALFGLGGWFFFLRSSNTTTQSADSARGFGTASPSFNSSMGSTYQNVLTDVTGASTESNTASSQTPSGGAPAQLWHVSANPTAGMGFVGKEASTTKIYFVERATGYVFSANTQSGDLLRVSNTLRTKIYEASFSFDGAVIERSLDETGHISTFAGTLASNSTSSDVALSGIVLEPDIISLAVDPNTRNFFYLVGSSDGSTIGIRAPWDDKKPKRVFSSVLRQWQSVWLQDNRIFLTQNASDNVPGSSFLLQSTGTLTPIIENQPGLTFLPKTGSQTVIFGTSNNGVLSLYVKKDAATAAVKLPIKTVADKCVWAPGKNLIAYCAVPQSLTPGNFLNDWYTGITHTADSIWRVNAQDASAQLVFAPASVDATIDVEHPIIDNSGSLIAFLNASDKSLWLLRLSTGTSTKSTTS